MNRGWLLLGLVAACAHYPDETLLTRAAFDLDCSEADLEVVEIDNRTRGVKGCGQRATYMLLCDTGVNATGTYQYNCSWVMNSSGERGREGP